MKILHFVEQPKKQHKQTNNMNNNNTKFVLKFKHAKRLIVLVEVAHFTLK